MADQKLSALTTIPVVDRAADLLYIVDVSAGTSNKVTTNTLLGVSGAPVGDTDSQTLTNKTLGNTNTVTLKDTLFTLQDDGDAAKQAQFQLSGITTGNTRTYTLPDATTTLVGIGTTQTLTNKTLTSPTINTPTITNATITADSVAGFSTSNSGTVYGVPVTLGAISGSVITANTVPNTALQTGIQTSKLSNQYKFSVFRTAALNSANTPTAVAHDTKTFDTGTNVDVVTNKGRFTAPVAGFYYFNAMAGNTVAAAGISSYLYKNGSQTKQGNYFGTTTGSLSAAAGLIQLATNDYVEHYFTGGSGSVMYVGSALCFFEGFLVSTT